MTDEKGFVKHPMIIKDQDLQEFDKIDDSDGGWAGAHGEIDYRYNTPGGASSNTLTF